MSQDVDADVASSTTSGESAQDLLPLVYHELRRLAASRLAQEKPGQTLQPTALVHEAYLRLIGGTDGRWQSRSHFFAAAAESMRRILVENARRKARVKHGGDLSCVELDEAHSLINAPSIDLLALDEALDKLAVMDFTKAELVKLRYFAGLSAEEAANCLGITRRVADRYWNYARAWLLRELGKDR